MKKRDYERKFTDENPLSLKFYCLAIKKQLSELFFFILFHACGDRFYGFGILNKILQKCALKFH